VPRQPITKSEQTRNRIFDAALALFAEKGYPATTLREIATRADCSLGLTYRYFARKEDLVLVLYERLTDELEEEVRALPPGPIAVRYIAAMRADLLRITPYRAAFGSLFGVALTPTSEVAILGERIALVRSRVWKIFLEVVEGATDHPKEAQARDLATIFYAGHLAMVLFWLQDRSEDQRRTHELIHFASETFGTMRPLLKLPPVAKALARLAEIITPLFGPQSTAAI
jgi:AcrR family transcriptional regulator